MGDVQDDSIQEGEYLLLIVGLLIQEDFPDVSM